ncbi:MAG: DUF2341 domain-containing protein [Gammaproteobacteria bacterium]
MLQNNLNTTIERGLLPEYRLSVYAVIILLFSSIPLSVNALTNVQLDTFDTFSCNAWQQLSTPSNIYYKQCTDGWNAMTPMDPTTLTSVDVAQDVSFGNPVPAVRMTQANTAPNCCGNQIAGGAIWAYKSFSVEPGVPIDTISLEHTHRGAFGTTRLYEINVYDGRVGNLVAGALPNILATETGIAGCAHAGFCGWITTTFNNLVPTSDSITIQIRGTTVSYAIPETVFDDVSVTQTIPDPGLASGDLAQAWIRHKNGLSGVEGHAVATDSAGNVYVTGQIDNANNIDVLTIKYNAAGEEQWIAQYDGGDDDASIAIDIDSAGNVVVLARQFNGTNDDYLTIKYDGSTGSELWLSPSVYDNGGDDTPVALGINSNNDIVVTGKSEGGAGFDFATVIYQGSDGAVINDTMRYDNGNLDAAVDLGIDGADNIYVTGRSDRTNQDIAVVNYDSAGNFQWDSFVIVPLAAATPSGQEIAVAIAVDSAGNSYVTGQRRSSSLTDYLTAKFDSAGIQQWRSIYNGQVHDIPVDIALDSSGNAIVTGLSGRPGDYDFATVKYNGASGAQQWASVFGSASVNDTVIAIKTDSADNVYVTGNSHGATPNYETVIYGTAGNQLNTFSYDNGGEDLVRDLALSVDSNGQTTIHITGASFGGLINDMATIKYAGMQPDLTVTNISGPASAFNDASISIDNTIENIFDPTLGKAVSAGSFDVGLYLAPDITGIPDLNNLISLGTRTIANLSTGATDTASTTITIPGPGVAAAGDYWLVAKADINTAINETDENNNIGVSTGVINITDAPDLVASVLSGPATAVAGSNITVNYTVDNVRAPDVTSFDIDFVLSTDTTIGNGDDIPLTGTETVASLLGNTSVANAVSVTIPNTITIGNYYIGMNTDSGSVITELDETNNTLASVATIAVTQIPDLIVSAISGPAGVTSGETITLSNTVENLNSVAAGSFTVSYYLSTDTAITTSDVLIGSRVISSLAANSNDVDTTAVTIPTLTSSGVYYFGAIADTAVAVIESDETNNSLSSSETVTVGFVASSGDGSDGGFAISANFNLMTGSSDTAFLNTSDGNGAQPDGFATALSVTTAAGATSITVGSTAGIVTGDEVLIIQMSDATSHGTYEFIQNVTVVDGVTLSFASPLTNSYSRDNATTDRVQVVRVPQYTALTINSGFTLTTSPYSHATGTGGIIAFRATSLDVSGVISADALGFVGGAGFVGRTGTGIQGRSANGVTPVASASPNLGGGGSASRRGSHGGSGGYGTAGYGVRAGVPYGVSDLSLIHLGSGGAGAGSYRKVGAGGPGGSGGGIVFIEADSITGAGSVSSQGGAGISTGAYYGGGGSGGAIYISTNSSFLTPATAITGGYGRLGNGGDGRLRVRTGGGDLRITDVTGPTTAARGDTIAVSTTVENILPHTVSNFKIGIYLSDDTTITTADTFLGDRTVAGLAGNGSDTASTNVTIPLTLYPSYDFRKAITIDAAKVSGTTDLTDFPVLVSITDANLATIANGGKVQNASGFDIIFRAVDGVTNLDFEVEQYDPVTGLFIAWVRVPVLSATTNTTVYIYYGNTAVTVSQENASAVWDANYKAVFHQNQDPSVSPQSDSTVNAFTAAQNGAMTSADLIDVQIGKGIDFDGIDDWLRTNTAVINQGTSDWTLELWAKTNVNAVQTIMQSENVQSIGRSLIYRTSTGTIDSYHNNATHSSGYVMTPGVMHHIVLVHDNAANQLRWYFNGVPGATNNGVAAENNAGRLRFGANKTPSAFFNGVMDEIRISQVQRSANWIATEYANQYAPATFYSEGIEEAGNVPQVYYLGAIADYDALIVEVDENNNAAIQTGVGGAPESTAVSVIQNNVSSNTGGGAFSLYGIMMMLVGLLIVIWQNSGISARRIVAS